MAKNISKTCNFGEHLTIDGIHTFPARRFVSIDAYTCNKNGLKKSFIIRYFKKVFELKEMEINFIKRGKKYSKFNII
ncbi:hypothetical protein AUJ30_00320 [Candidatus Wolfebacteria bacterium CG1_02_39_135]|uniref:Uncharacterized protein n=3 Tax=Candidatus Wolfeibacteriota TaxID=1752735 RepID=A0A2M8DA73_9BACT|nr:hypothetical protein [Candidatus Parcubacteria bacterium]NCO89547.1 hypothetical protein [Candidatus Wolfebacteria bacterium]OIO65833.1 MAG: hypothetical protein AUJ30_00320 [Candidatus Wolfebacteria bacterium CG1_02_39_135]PIU98913.1 MAG: hypothetical protein COS60_00575 [Candidatus Wolfebacteria bacterium CG03_land_8_20_14_0_80_39_317]PJB84062.1 MAG: hypothetical protein CO087_00565 [Candidatus Wolfebacteria bacterium CG_4_9_14_0_8_um_filter_39_46]